MNAAPVSRPSDEIGNPPIDARLHQRTVAKHLSVEAERAGDGPVSLIDTDPTGWPYRMVPASVKKIGK